MRLIYYTWKVIFFLALFLIGDGCSEKIVEDPCLKTKWPQTKEFEIKLAVKVIDSNPLLPGGAPGSQKPADFVKMALNGTIEFVECNDQTTGPVSIGNTYITKGIDLPAAIYVPDAWWIGHVVYVYEFGNDNDHLNINLSVKVTMGDNQSYICNVSEEISDEQIEKMAVDSYYFILLDIYSDNWVKV